MQLVVVDQGSLEQDKIYEQGVQKNVHAVIKNQPFRVRLRIEGDFDKRLVNFHTFTAEAVLMYDMPDENKPVDFVRSCPMQYLCHVQKDSRELEMEVKLAVLSSQHEDMFFVIQFVATPEADSGHKSFHVYSESIKVVSKPAQLKMNRTLIRKKKRPTLNENILTSLARIEEQQLEHQALIGSLFQSIAVRPGLSCPSSPDEDLPVAPATNKRRRTLPPILKAEPSSPCGGDVEFHLRGLLGALRSLAGTDAQNSLAFQKRLADEIPRNMIPDVEHVVDSLSHGLGIHPDRSPLDGADSEVPPFGGHSFGSHEEGAGDGLDLRASDFDVYPDLMMGEPLLALQGDYFA